MLDLTKLAPLLDKTLIAGSSLKDIVAKAKNTVESLVLSAASAQVSGPEKKAAVMDAFGVFYDNVVSYAPIPWVPSVLSVKLFLLLRPVVMEVASHAIEYAVSLLNSKVQA